MARRVKAAAMSTPVAAASAQTGSVCQAPMRMVSSAGKPLKPGMPIEARPASTNTTAAKGISLCRGRARRSARRRVCVRS